MNLSLMSKPMVTIVTVCYNSETTIERCMQSVLNQTYDNIEYIIIDGESHDQTMNLIKKYQKKFGERMRVISEPDQGIYDAMNKGIREASGRIIGILNSDDYYVRDAVENIVSVWNGKGMQILYGLMRTMKEGKEYSLSRLSHYFLHEQMIWHPACFVTEDVYKVIGDFDTKYRSVADYDFMLRAYDSGKVQFVPVDATIVNFSEGGMSGSAIGYLEGLRYRHQRGDLSGITYYLACIYEPIRQWARRRLWK